jgi:RNA polymerase sigma-70 factor (ECF subfamily)
MVDEAGKKPSRAAAADITLLLSACAEGSPDAHARLLEAVYRELHQIARGRMRAERGDHTLSATALVNEAYLKLLPGFAGTQGTDKAYADRRSFFHAAATAMRRILIDHARARQSQKRAGRHPAARHRVPLDVLIASTEADPADLLSLDEAISRLEEVDARAAEVVRLRFFAGQDLETVGTLLGVSSRTVKRDWEFARAWLQQALDAHEDAARPEGEP